MAKALNVGFLTLIIMYALNIAGLGAIANALLAGAGASAIQQCINVPVTEGFCGKSDYLAVVENQTAVQDLKPDLSKVAALLALGLIVTAKGNTVDFVSRFFAPQYGIDEDLVTGPAYTLLIPYWTQKLEKTTLEARQLSQRGGALHCHLNGKRCLIGGQAKLYLIGYIYTD